MSLLAIVTRAVDAIVSDLSDRRGFNDPWYCIDEEIQEEIKAAWRTIITQEIQKDDAVNLDALPQANNTRVNYLGRNIFSIEGHPGLYMQKKPTPMGPNPEPIAAKKNSGKGGNSGTFYRVPELEAELIKALGGDDVLAPVYEIAARKMEKALQPCPKCDYDEAEGALVCHCPECQHRVTLIAWTLYAMKLDAREVQP